MFVPKISITGIPLDASTLTVTDITGTSPTDATGYDLADHLPQDNTIWTKFAEIQYLGTSAVDLTFDPAADNVAVDAEFAYQMTDGVYLVTQYWRREVLIADLEYTYATLEITDTGTGIDYNGDLGILTGVWGISADGAADITPEGAQTITSVDSTTVATVSGDPGTLTAKSYLFHKVQQYVLISNSGVSALHSSIGDMALAHLAGGSCSKETVNDLFNKVLLKSSATINFNCGNYAKAHNAAILLSELSTVSTSICQGCV